MASQNRVTIACMTNAERSLRHKKDQTGTFVRTLHVRAGRCRASRAGHFQRCSAQIVQYRQAILLWEIGCEPTLGLFVGFGEGPQCLGLSWKINMGNLGSK